MKFTTREPFVSRAFGTVREIEIERRIEQIDMSAFGSLHRVMVPGLSRSELRIVADERTTDVWDVWRNGGTMRFDEVIGENRFHGDIILFQIDVADDRTTIRASSIGTFEIERADAGVLLRNRVKEIRNEL